MEFAVKDDRQGILHQADGFDPVRVTAEARLSGGARLRVRGGDALARENARLRE